MLLHFACDDWNDTVQSWRALEAAARSGKARAIGVSNFNRTDIEKLVATAEIPPAVNQAGFAIGSPQNATLGRDWGTITRSGPPFFRRHHLRPPAAAPALFASASLPLP